MSGDPQGPRVPGEALFRLLLRLHPRTFRERYERDMVELFRDAWGDRVRGRGVLARLRFWIGVVAGTAWSAAGQRWTGRNPTTKRDAGGEATVTTWIQDLRYAARTLIKRPGFAAVVVLTLALGIGANTAVFSVLHAVLLAPLPYEDGGRLVRIYESRTDNPDFRNYLAAAASSDLRETLTTTSSFSVLYNYQQESADLTDGDRPERVKVLPVSQGYFEAVGTEPMLGRTFDRSEEDGSVRVAIVSRRVFENYLGGDPEALGRSLTLDGAEATVVGVMPEGYRDPYQGRIDVLTPVVLDLDGSDAWGNHYLTSLVRLRPGATIEQLRAELASAAERHERLSGEEDLAYAAVLLRDDLVGTADTTLWMLMGAAALVFLIACVNVAGVTLARGSARRRELAIRVALGSGRGRLVRQLLTESALLAALGGAAGLALGAGVSRVLASLAPADLPGLAEAGLEGPVFLFGLGASAAAVFLFGVLPALRASRTSVEGALRESGRGGGRGAPAGSRLRKGLVVGEVALALTLLVGAGVLVRSVQHLAAVDLTVDAANVTHFQVSTPGARYDADARARFHRRYLERLEAIPGVEAAAATSWLPVGGNYHNWGASRPEDGPDTESVGTNQRVVEGDYFATLGIDVVRGRAFGPEDGPDDPDRIVINRAAAEALFPDGEDPVGRVLEIGPWPKEIVGVVEDVPTSARGRVRPIVYHRHAQFADNRNWTLRYVVKLRGPEAGVVTRARDALAELDPSLVLYEPGLLSERLAAGRAADRFAMTLLAAFAAVALLLAAVGIYGVLAQSVNRRRHELGVRVALGARGRDVRAMVVRQGLALAAGGVLAGLAAAAAGARWLESLVFQVSVRDPVVFAAVPLMVLAVAAMASWIPAARATRIDPMEAFRTE